MVSRSHKELTCFFLEQAWYRVHSSTRKTFIGFFKHLCKKKWKFEQIHIKRRKLLKWSNKNHSKVMQKQMLKH